MSQQSPIVRGAGDFPFVFGPASSFKRQYKEKGI